MYYKNKFFFASLLRFVNKTNPERISRMIASAQDMSKIPLKTDNVKINVMYISLGYHTYSYIILNVFP